MKLERDLRQIQIQRLSPLMLRSLNVLQLSATALNQLISEEVQRNPFFDLISDHDIFASKADARGISEHGYAYNSSNNGEADLNYLENIAAEFSPQDYLLHQVPDLDEALKSALIILINSLDERGFLPKDVMQKFGLLENDVEEQKNKDSDTFDGAQQDIFKKAYVVLRSLSPKGIGARNLQDCLRLQIPQDTPLYDLIANHFDDLEHHRFAKLQRIFHRTSSELRTLLTPLKYLNFAPLKAITSHINPPIIPELIFQKIDHQWIFEVNGMPEIRMNDNYGNLSLGQLKPDDRKFFTENRQHAQFWIRSLQQRRETLQKIARYILKFQVDFLENGQAYLRPQNQKQVAELLEIHPSTLSRAIKNKYVQTPRGIIPLNFFFSHGNCSSLMAQNTLKENIMKIIKDEHKNQPFSDEAIAEILKSEGVWITRRTVAKYRAILNIPAKNIRKYLSV